ncbi:MAG: [FeFe] hydrogenase H-cluster radical SAM maturase HydG [bacterium]|nr:[FeFe] hydrogenase H-cluster radical SAM maturase HydG [bacterium]
MINEQEIIEILKNVKSRDITPILAKSLAKKRLDLEEVATLLNADEQESPRIFKAAKKLKQEIYGNRLVFFAPLYISNLCSNDCLYCGFRSSNKEINRVNLSQEQIKEDTLNILKQGHKRILLVSGEAWNKEYFDYILDSIRTIYSVEYQGERIRRINVNIAPLEASEFKRLKKSDIGTYQLFQETYHRETYSKMHLRGPKSNYDKRLDAIDKSFDAGIDDVGVGVLFGLYEYKFEFLALMQHITYLENKYGIGPHTISVPRMEPAQGSDVSLNPPYSVDDESFKKIIAILRLAVPYTGIILSTREKAEFRNEAINLGVSQLSAASKTNPGGYSSGDATKQFDLSDERSLAEVIKACCDQGYLPSFCTSCYRLGRTGHDFMECAKDGSIKDICKLNAILTFKEYLEDYGTPELKKDGEILINKEIGKLTDAEKVITRQKIRKIESGERDVCL